LQTTISQDDANAVFNHMTDSFILE
jgi:hypothetical protein